MKKNYNYIFKVDFCYIWKRTRFRAQVYLFGRVLQKLQP